MIHLTLYTRPECHLCEVMLAELEPLIDGRADVQCVDISGDGQLTQQFGLLIPVLMHEQEELARYRLDRDRLDAFFRRSAP